VNGHRISVEVKDTNKIPIGKGFYDNSEGILNFAIKTKGKFHSYIQSDCLSMDLDKKGGLLNIEVSVEREAWVEETELAPPGDVACKKLRFLDYRLNIEGESYHTNRSRDLLYICFSDDDHVKTYEIAENLLADVNLVNELAGLWILNLVDDFGFRSEMAFRRGNEATAPE
jgi:uncharacterized protein YuzE